MIRYFNLFLIIRIRLPLLQDVEAHAVQRLDMRALQLHPGNIFDSLVDRAFPLRCTETEALARAHSGLAQVGPRRGAEVEKGVGEGGGDGVSGIAHACVY